MVTSELDRRVRLGVVLPSVNTVVEPWYARTVPSEVSVHFDRMLLSDVLTPENVIRMDQDEGMAAVRRLASCRPRAVAYGCTASSIVKGWDYDCDLRAEITDALGVPATTPSTAIRKALEAVGARRLVVVSPYTAEIDRRERAFFEDAGFEIVGGASFDIGNAFLLASPTAEMQIELARSAWADNADALLITCLNIASHAAILPLEQQLQRPVVTATQATLWHLLHLAEAGASIGALGRLSEKRPAA